MIDTMNQDKGIAKNIAAETGAFLIPAYDHYDVISGQGTALLRRYTKWPLSRRRLIILFALWAAAV
ncbi:MAG: hypothetical protein Ct9H300mP6_08830 [Gammaproteobacteria bacterium]|nr:MAG: hypothetical protein Ct9H300mP6_08830 [Gammaproteobacteria bacterium]